MKPLKLFILIVACCLLLLNIYGLFASMRNPEIYNYVNGKDRVEIPFEETIKQLTRNESESDKDFAIRMNELVHRSTVHYWKTDERDVYNMQPPIWENYILFYRSLKDSRYKYYEFHDYKKALERGIGLCSQRARILYGILKDNKVPVKMIGLDGHVVTTAMVEPDVWYILDPDFNVYIPYDLEYIESNLDIVKKYYVKQTFNNDEVLPAIYEKTGNLTFELNDSEEKEAYRDIWLIPIKLILLSFALHFISLLPAKRLKIAFLDFIDYASKKQIF